VRRGILTIILFLVYLVPSVWSLYGILDLVTSMGRHGSNYPAYGISPGQVLTAYAVLLTIVLWLLAGMIVTGFVIRRKLNMHWLGVVSALSALVVLPLTFVYCLGAGYS
jgi:hypothetical protein